MTGAINIKVKNRRNSYNFTLKRNITILRGDSGTGKTTLYDMIKDYNNFGRKDSGVSISCNNNIVVLEGKDWEQQLEGLSKSIVVIDEGSSFISSQDFARKVKGSDNYFLIITRTYLAQLPYSAEEVYYIKGSGKNKSFEKEYKHIDRFYDNPDPDRFPFQPNVIITEDSGAGFQFFSNVAESAGIICVSAKGKSGISKVLQQYEEDNVIIVADGAAIGAEMKGLVKRQELSHGKLAIFLPESFEWMILSSGVIGKNVNADKLNETQNYADSVKYMSWEQYFTKLLENSTSDSSFNKYDKRKLSTFYTKPDIKAKILEQMPHADFTAYGKDDI